jgi:hypothetical protein
MRVTLHSSRCQRVVALTVLSRYHRNRTSGHERGNRTLRDCAGRTGWWAGIQINKFGV